MKMWPDMSKSHNSVHPVKGDMHSAITSQPTLKDPKPNDLPEIPEGLGALEKTQHLFIQQSGLPIEIFSSVETQYEVLNSDGEKIFMADETTDTSTKAWCRGTKPFDVSILIRSGMYRKEVLKMDGEPRSCGCGGDITLRSTRTTLGIVEHGTECYSYPHYYIRDSEGQEILRVIGPPSSRFCCGSLNLDQGGQFDVMLPDGKTVIGKIAKYWAGKEKEMLLKSDIWGVKFPLDMKVTHKALLLSACFLLNFQHQNVE